MRHIEIIGCANLAVLPHAPVPAVAGSIPIEDRVAVIQFEMLCHLRLTAIRIVALGAIGRLTRTNIQRSVCTC